MIPCVYNFSAIVIVFFADSLSFREPSFSNSMVSMACGRHLFFGFCVTFVTCAVGFAWHTIKNASQQFLSNRRCRPQLNSTVKSFSVCVTVRKNGKSV